MRLNAGHARQVVNGESETRNSCDRGTCTEFAKPKWASRVFLQELSGMAIVIADVGSPANVYGRLLGSGVYETRQ